jgi:hypothetical protein
MSLVTEMFATVNFEKVEKWSFAVSLANFSRAAVSGVPLLYRYKD